MYFKQFYLGCLAHASYLIGDGGVAAVVDPQRDVQQYLDEAQAQGLAIKYILETHLHADFVSGHLELARRTGAEILISRKAKAEFPHRGLVEGDRIALGQARLTILETPGHTPESITIEVREKEDAANPVKILTGDTLFIGDVGRPDLAGAKGASPQEMAAQLYDSLWGKILTLPDAVEVYPAHGAGSLCGRNMSKETFSTLGEQRKSNYALKVMTREEFVKMATDDLPEAPGYFSHDVETNRRGAQPLDQLPLPAALAPAQVKEKCAAGTIVLDVRSYQAFGTGHVPRSVNIGLSGQFASWAGAILGPRSPVIIVADDEQGVRETVMRLARVGLENVVGFLDGGIAAWDAAGLVLEQLPLWSVDELRAQLRDTGIDLQIIDVRRPGEFGGGHIATAQSMPLNQLEQQLRTLNTAKPTAVICGSGYRSSAAASLLRKHGFATLYNIAGGMNAWNAAHYETRT